MSLKKKLQKLLHPQSAIAGTIHSVVQRECQNVLLQLKKDELLKLALHSIDSGVSKEKICKEEVVVSFTTFGARFYDSYLAVESIMQGSVKPNRIVMWVSEDFKDVAMPIVLQNQMRRGLEIRFCRDIRSYTKLIYSLKEFPESTIITVDDDIIYPYDMVEGLINVHNSHPSLICANVVKYLPPNIKDIYTTFIDLDLNRQYLSMHERCIFEGHAGVLYPPKSLHPEVFNENIFMSICKYADDIWFSAMAMLNHTKTINAHNHMKYLFMSNDDVQSVALQKINVQGEVLNDAQFKAVFEKYNLM